MRRALLYIASGLNVGCALIQTVALMHEFATNAPVSGTALTMALLICNTMAAAWAFGRALEVRP